MQDLSADVLLTFKLYFNTKNDAFDCYRRKRPKLQLSLEDLFKYAHTGISKYMKIYFSKSMNIPLIISLLDNSLQKGVVASNFQSEIAGTSNSCIAKILQTFYSPLSNYIYILCPPFSNSIFQKSQQLLEIAPSSVNMSIQLRLVVLISL